MPMRWLALLLVSATLLGSAHAATMTAGPEEMHDGSASALLVLVCGVLVAVVVVAIRRRPVFTAVRLVAPGSAPVVWTWAPAPQRVDGSARASPAWLQRFLR